MGFRLVPKLVTSNDLERHNGCVVCIISPNSVAFEAYYVKVAEDTPPHSGSEIPMNLVFSSISLITIFAGIIPSDGVKVK